MVFKLLVASRGDLFLQLGVELGLLHWDHGVLATGPPGRLPWRPLGKVRVAPSQLAQGGHSLWARLVRPSQAGCPAPDETCVALLWSVELELPDVGAVAIRVACLGEVLSRGEVALAGDSRTGAGSPRRCVQLCSGLLPITPSVYTRIEFLIFL